MFARLMSALVLLSLFATLPCRAEDPKDYYKRLEDQQRRYDQDRINYAWLYEDSDDCYAAIAYSEKTGKFGYSFDFNSRGAANAEALRRCPADDARVVTWSQNAYCALAKGDDGYGTAWGWTAAEAREKALRECAKHTTNGKILVCVFSGN